MSRISWPVITHWLFVVLSVVFLSTMLSQTAAAQQEIDGNQYIIIWDDEGSEDYIYGFARLLSTNNSANLDTYAVDYLTRDDPNQGDWAVVLETYVYCDNELEDHYWTYDDGQSGGFLTYEEFWNSQSGQQIWFDVGYGQIDKQYYEFWWIDANNDLYLDLQ